MLTTEQQRVFDWLNDKLGLPVFAETYKGAIHMLNERPPGYITFVAHTGRDIMNTLATAVSGFQPGRVQYRQLLDGVQNEWKEEWGAEGLNQIDGAENGHLIPYDTCQKIKNLIDKHKDGSIRSSGGDGLFFSTFLDYGDRESIPPNFLRDWKSARDWFLKHAHLRKPDFADDVRSEVEKHFSTLDSLLYVAASSEFERIKGIDEILEETNG